MQTHVQTPLSPSVTAAEAAAMTDDDIVVFELADGSLLRMRERCDGSYIILPDAPSPSA